MKYKCLFKSLQALHIEQHLSRNSVEAHDQQGQFYSSPSSLSEKRIDVLCTVNVKFIVLCKCFCHIYKIFSQSINQVSLESPTFLCG